MPGQRLVVDRKLSANSQAALEATLNIRFPNVRPANHVANCRESMLRTIKRASPSQHE